jgi:isopenicillin-N N-acyltransferase like protein
MLKRTLKIVSLAFALLLTVVVGFIMYVKQVSVTEPPRPLVKDTMSSLTVTEPDSGLYTIGNNWFRKSESGLYELYVEGDAFERGLANGMLTRDLVQYQEEVFQQQIETLVPSSIYRDMLRHFIGYFNRNLDRHIPEEYKLEIYGVSMAASEKYNDIAQPYQRILNYHAAHDIGHALQNMSLVGCTSFATWGGRSEDGELLIGRNFDFYVGDEFARDKIIAFYKPDKGYRFMMVTFGGMTGVLSGMNESGLTVTINAAKSEIPSGSATPVSLVAREMLQYASTIEEAYAIARQRKMFVAESFLVGSAQEKKAALIEKTPDAIDIVYPSDNYIVSTNHFQSDRLGQTDLNQEHMRTSASVYRYQRVLQLLEQTRLNTPYVTAGILRDQRGLSGEDIGLGNEKVINQLVAHHGIIFQPEKKLVWISTAPWTLGKFVCYDLNKIFSLNMDKNVEVHEVAKTIESDPFIHSPLYNDYVKFHRYRFPFNPMIDLQPDSVTKWNPRSYHAWMLGGNYYFDKKQFARAKAMYEKALQCEVATSQERDHIETNLKTCNDKLK